MTGHGKKPESLSGMDGEPPFPAWIRARLPAPEKLAPVTEMLRDLGLHTVCGSAHCPNIGECFARRVATFLIMGPFCTRACRFCAVRGGAPAPLDADEPRRVAEAVRRLGLRHVVVTSVTRDDLPDGGAGHFAETIRLLHDLRGVSVEVLTPDFLGDPAAIRTVAGAGPEIFNHNLETVPRLYPEVRPEAVYQRSLELLALVGREFPRIVTKSGLMLGLGETSEEIRAVLLDLRGVGCAAVTLGQYLRPGRDHHPVVRFVPPAEFEDWRLEALGMGFRAVASAPLVRSSFLADQMAEGLSSGTQRPGD